MLYRGKFRKNVLVSLFPFACVSADLYEKHYLVCWRSPVAIRVNTLISHPYPNILFVSYKSVMFCVCIPVYSLIFGAPEGTGFLKGSQLITDTSFSLFFSCTVFWGVHAMLHMTSQSPTVLGQRQRRNFCWTAHWNDRDGGTIIAIMWDDLNTATTVAVRKTEWTINCSWH